MNDIMSESSRQKSDNTFRSLGQKNNGQFDNNEIAEERDNMDNFEVESSAVPYLSKENDTFLDCFKFGNLDVQIPFERLDQ